MIPQAAAIPFRIRKGKLEVLLITSRSSGRWIVPKGMIDPGFTAAEAAQQEAFEEAGVKGPIEEALGSFVYTKWARTCEVQVFSLRVEEVLDDWEEKDSRTRRWVPAEKAAEMVNQPDLAKLLSAFAKDPG